MFVFQNCIECMYQTHIWKFFVRVSFKRWDKVRFQVCLKFAREPIEIAMKFLVHYVRHSKLHRMHISNMNLEIFCESQFQTLGQGPISSLFEFAREQIEIAMKFLVHYV